MTADGFDALGDDEAAARLRECCAASGWIAAMLAARPFGSVDAALASSATALDELDWAGVREALDAHPRIGDRAEGRGREAAWSRQEQAGTASSTDEVKAALVEANRAYEDRFGHVFLIFATGRTDVEMLRAARDRLANDEAVERAVVRQELGRIVALRLTRMLAS